MITLYTREEAKSIAKTKAEIQRDYEKRTEYAAKKKYEKKIIKILLRLNPDSDKDIITKLDFSEPLAPQIKKLIRSK